MKFAEQLQQQVKDLRKLIKEQNEIYSHFQTRESKAIEEWSNNFNKK